MRTVRDGDGHRYLLLKESAEASLVRDPATGERRHLPNDDLEPVEESPLVTAARQIEGPTRPPLAGLPGERALGLLLEIDDRGPVGVRTLLDAYDLCESDLHGLLAEFRAAGLVKEARVAGERGYESTAAAADALDRLRE